MAAEHRRYELALQIGTEANRQHLWRQAVTALRIARQGMPYDARVYAALGDACLGIGLYPYALTCFKIAVRLDRKKPLYMQRVADVQLFLGQREEAAHTYMLLGRHYQQREEAAQMQSCWQRAVELAPELLAPRWRLALLQLRQNDRSGAVDHYLSMGDTLERHGQMLPALHLRHLALYLRPQDRVVLQAVEQAWHSVVVGRVANLPTLSSGRPASALLPGSLLTAALSLAQWQLTQEVRRLPMPVGTMPGGSAENKDNVHHVLRHGALQHALYHETRGNAGGAVIAYERAVAYGLRLPAAFFALGLLYRLVGREPDARCVLRLAAQDPFYRQAVTLIGYG